MPPAEATDPHTPAVLRAALEAFAAAPEVLVAIDFDGTLAPLVDEPLAARPLPGALDRMRALAALPRTTVAIVSGRALDTLRRLSGAGEQLLLVGSHGAETSYEVGGRPQDVTEQLLYDDLDGELAEVVRAHPQARIERKPHSLVLHTRGLDPHVEAAALRDGQAVAARHPDIVVTPGKGVLELATRHVGKGTALRELAQRQGASATLYAGDDTTDEDAFAALGPDDVTVKVGPGPTGAAHRLPDEAAVVALLEDLLALRRAATSD